MAFFIQILLAGIAAGCIYALVALGFTIIFKSSGVINFAQGELLLLGAYLVSAGVSQWHLNFFLALPIAIAITVAIAVGFERFALRRMIGRPAFSILMLTIGLDTLLLTAVIAIWPDVLYAPAAPYSTTAGFDIGGVHVTINDIWTIIVTGVLCAALYAFFRYTRYGLAMRAAALDQEAALAVGINVGLVNTFSWAIAAAIATIGGFFLAVHLSGVNPGLGVIALVAFPAIILGGIDSVLGAVVGGLIIGLVQQLTAGYENTAVFHLLGQSFTLTDKLGPSFDAIAPYLVMLVVLLIRPYGLFGKRKVERI
jgi:branched-chain amino acid transport system permease protein